MNGTTLILVRDSVELHFAGPAVGSRPSGFAFVYVDDADSLYAEWQGKATSPGRIERPIHTNYGMRVFVIVDPDDNEVRVGSAAKPEPFKLARAAAKHGLDRTVCLTRIATARVTLTGPLVAHI